MIGLKGLKIGHNAISSPSRTVRWRDGRLRADRTPTKHNSSGIYTTFHLAEAASYSPYIFAVEGWGNTVMGTDGFRSQFARAIACLPLIPLTDAQMQTLERLRIPVLSQVDQIAELIPHMSKSVGDGLYIRGRNVLIYGGDGHGRYNIDHDDPNGTIVMVYSRADAVDIRAGGRLTNVRVHADVERMDIKAISASIIVRAEVDHLRASADKRLVLFGTPSGSILQMRGNHVLVDTREIRYASTEIEAERVSILFRAQMRNVRIRAREDKIRYKEDLYRIVGPDQEGWFTIQPREAEE